VGVGVAYAQEKEKSNKSKMTAEEKFQKLNKAGDGKLTLKEYLVRKKDKDAAKQAFDAADKDKKGYLTLDEFKTIYPPRHKALTAEEKFKKLNKAGDGKRTLAEYTAGKKETKAAAEEAFKAADKDKKGYLTLDEFKTIYPPRHHKHRKHGGDQAPEKSPELPAEKPADKAPESK
jgi:Ca2+-binding EF-hand superfamily protein